MRSKYVLKSSSVSGSFCSSYRRMNLYRHDLFAYDILLKKTKGKRLLGVAVGISVNCLIFRLLFCRIPVLKVLWTVEVVCLWMIRSDSPTLSKCSISTPTRTHFGKVMVARQRGSRTRRGRGVGGEGRG